MRIIKSNSVKYRSFHASLPEVMRNKTSFSDRDTSVRGIDTTLSGEAERNNNYLHQVLEFQNEIRKTKNPIDISNLFREVISNTLGYREAKIYLYNFLNKQFSPVGEDEFPRLTKILNNEFRKGQLSWIFEKGQSTILPGSGQELSAPLKLNNIVLPVMNEGKKLGLVTVQAPLSTLLDYSDSSWFNNICIGIVFEKLQKLGLKKDLTSTVKNLQAYQSKFANDFKLSAIGELTTGVVEDILSQLQIILGHTDLLARNSTGQSTDSLDKIKYQVKKAETTVKRLIKFASVNDKQIKVQACDVNFIVHNFYKIIDSTLQRDNYECLLDLERDLPPVLSHPSYINQLLTMIFSIIKPGSKNGGGIFIQSKYVKEIVTIKIVTSDYFEELNSKKYKGEYESMIKIIDDIMKKHQGKFLLNSSKDSGTSFILLFPLRQNLTV